MKRAPPALLRAIRESEARVREAKGALGKGPAPGDGVEIEGHCGKARGAAGYGAARGSGQTARDTACGKAHFALAAADPQGKLFDRERLGIAQRHACGSDVRRALAERPGKFQRAAAGGKTQAVAVREHGTPALGAERHLLARERKAREREALEAERRAAGAERQAGGRRPSAFERERKVANPAPRQNAAGAHQALEGKAAVGPGAQRKAGDSEAVRPRSIVGHRHAQRPAAVCVHVLRDAGVDGRQASAASKEVSAEARKPRRSECRPPP